MIIPDIFKNFPELCSGISTKYDITTFNGLVVSKVDPISYHKNFFSKMGIPIEIIARPVQCHTDRVLYIDRPGKYDNCDALLTDRTNVALVVSVADCVPVLLFDPVKKVIGIVHAGWRGSSKMITAKAIRKLKNMLNIETRYLLAYIGPSAGVCCYEVDKKIIGKFNYEAVSYKNEKYFIDLKLENILQLKKEGLMEKNIQVNDKCTICNNDIFFSYRREGNEAGRLLAAICLIR